MGLKVRGDRINEYKGLSVLYKERKEKVDRRKDLEIEITRQNEQMIKHLVNLLKPLCTKMGFGVHMAICDSNVEISTEIGYKFKRGGTSARVYILQDKVAVWMTDGRSIKAQLRALEKNMRLFKKMVDSPQVQLRPSNLVVVSIQTRNRYF